MRNTFIYYVGLGLSIMTFSLSVFSTEVVDKTISVSGWMGAASSDLTFSEPAQGMTLYGSSESDCNYENYQLCVDGQSNVITGSVLSTEAATIDQAGYYRFNEVGQSTDYIISTALFHGRKQHQVVTFQDKIWVIGGLAHDQTLLNDIWASHNGYTWVSQSEAGSFSARKGHHVLVFDNKLWLFGGYSDGTYQSDIWSSTDGVNWQEITPDIPVTMSWFTRAATFNNKLWLLDFDDTGTPSIYSSSDGSSWSVVDMPAGLAALSRVVVTEFNGKLRALGVYGNEIELWVSENGTSWSQEDDSVTSASAGYGPEKVIVHNSNICMINDFPGKDMRCSSSGDANTWSKKGSTNLNDYDTEAIVNFNETLYLVGGEVDLSIPEVPPIKSSSNGTYWGHWPAGTVVNIPEEPEVVVFDSKLIAAGGALEGRIASSGDGLNWNKDYPIGLSFPQDYKLFSLPTELLLLELSASDKKRSYTSELSVDGGNWEQVATSLPMDSRARFASVLFDNKAWVIGGYNSQRTHNTDTWLSDVWSSADGVTWSEVTADAAFDGQENPQVISHSGSMWLLENDGNAVWSSSDGAVWVQKTAASVTPAREFSGFTAFNGKLWIIGGIDSSGQELNDIWSSSDGASWTREIEVASFPTVFGHKLISRNGRLFMIRGESKGSPLAHVWSTEDGLIWLQGYEDNIDVKTEGYVLDVLASDGGAADVVTPIVARGTRGSIELDADNYFELDSVEGCAGDLNEDQTLFTTELMSADCTLNASFKQVKFLVNSSVNTLGLGSIFPSFGVYNFDQSQTFEITLNAQNLEIQSVTGCNGVLDGTSYQVDGFDANCQIDLVISVIEVPVDPEIPEDPQPEPEDETENNEELDSATEAAGSFNALYLMFIMVMAFALRIRRNH